MTRLRLLLIHPLNHPPSATLLSAQLLIGRRLEEVILHRPSDHRGTAPGLDEAEHGVPSRGPVDRWEERVRTGATLKRFQ